MAELRSILTNKLPPASLSYCLQLWEEAPFQFKVSRSRSSKLGDYRFDPRTGMHTVTVNGDLNPYQFLITYVHEVAHRRVHQPKGRLKPHGQHWKNEFKKLLLPVMNDQVFPDDILRPLARHMKNPKASTATDHQLFQAIAQHDEQTAQIRLIDLSVGEQFGLKQRYFELLEKKRTRALCLDLRNQRKYLIPMIAEVVKRDQSFG